MKNPSILNGPILKNLLIFAIPIAVSGILQLVFNLADMAVVGKYAAMPKQSLAAIGSNGALINILIQLFMGFSIGANIVIARSIGEKNYDKASRATHSAILLSLICGSIVLIIGSFFCRYFLIWLKVPNDVIDLAESYIRIYFMGVPFLMVYNFGAAILRANGETRKPLYYLLSAGIINLILNIIFVKYFHLDVVGVALATIASELISAILVIISLFRRKDMIKLELKKLRIHKLELMEILRDGIPAGIHSMMYSIANVIIQSDINSFGSIVMAGNSAAFNLTNLVSTGYYGIVSATTTFISQNMGAKNYSRINIITRDAIISVVSFALIGTTILLVFEKSLISIFNSDLEVIEAAHHQIMFVGLFLFLDASVSTSAGIIRGMGKSFQSMIITILGICVVRITYLFTFFKIFKTLNALYVVYPISWFIALMLNIIYYLHLLKIYHIPLIFKKNKTIEQKA